MKIICIKGGLGNQMFEYCRYRLHKDSGRERTYLYIDRRQVKEHSGCKLGACFNIKLPSPSPAVLMAVLLIKALRTLGLFKALYDDSDEERVTLIDDFSQDKSFITNARGILKFRSLQDNGTAARYERLIKACPCAVSVHFRRGDYTHPKNISHFGICPPTYYEKAVSRVLEALPEAHFFIFSDDMEWVRGNFKAIDPQRVTYIENSPSKPDYADMYLMTLCRGHITANSTFSFWGAYLSEENAITIYPDRWYADREWVRPDIFPSEWIGI